MLWDLSQWMQWGESEASSKAEPKQSSRDIAAVEGHRVHVFAGHCVHGASKCCGTELVQQLGDLQGPQGITLGQVKSCVNRTQPMIPRQSYCSPALRLLSSYLHCFWVILTGPVFIVVETSSHVVHDVLMKLGNLGMLKTLRWTRCLQIVYAVLMIAGMPSHAQGVVLEAMLSACDCCIDDCRNAWSCLSRGGAGKGSMFQNCCADDCRWRQ